MTESRADAALPARAVYMVGCDEYTMSMSDAFFLTVSNLNSDFARPKAE